MRRLLGLDRPPRSARRAVLEDVILPHYGAREDIQRVLFVGMNRSTRQYWRFFRGKEYWSIDFDPTKQQFAGRLHITDTVEHLENYFRSGHFDVIVVSSLRFRGRIDLATCERAFAGCWSRLRPGGELVLGVCGSETIAGVPIRELKSLAGFRLKPFPPLSSSQHRAGDHVYDFYERPTPARR